MVFLATVVECDDARGRLGGVQLSTRLRRNNGHFGVEDVALLTDEDRSGADGEAWIIFVCLAAEEEDAEDMD